MPNWIEEIFKLGGQSRGKKRKVYTVSDWAGDEIHGVFYPVEVQKVVRKPNKKFATEKVLKKKTEGDRQFCREKWSGHPEKFNSWIGAQDVNKK